jgi:hypothetical protein
MNIHDKDEKRKSRKEKQKAVKLAFSENCFLDSYGWKLPTTIFARIEKFSLLLHLLNSPRDVISIDYFPRHIKSVLIASNKYDSESSFLRLRYIQLNKRQML